MNNRLGIDLGTHSYSASKRNLDKEGNQIEFSTVIRFDSGVGTDKSGGVFTYSSVRTKNRGIRNRYKSEKDRKLELLKWLIKYNMCPLSEQELKEWKRYVKPSRRQELGESRKFPKGNKSFLKWLICDFDYDSESFKPDFENIYELRASLIDKKQEDSTKHKLGRVLYHVAHHRGFKSSKKVKEPDDKNDEEINDLQEEFLKGAEKKRVKEIDKLLEKHNVETIGEAFSKELKEGKRVRANLQQYAIRKRQQDEVELILQRQGLEKNSEEYRNLIQAIFFQKKLKTQKGNIGKCTLEKNKTRCYISHYAFEEFSAREFLNNVRINGEQLSKDNKEYIYQNLFLKRLSSSIKFLDIKKFLIEKLNYNPDAFFNYRDKQTIGLCPISAYFYKIFGENWRELSIKTEFIKSNSKRTDKKITYTIEDIWHILLDEEDENKIKELALNKLKLSEQQTLWLINCSKKFEQGFASFSLNAINKILPFLRLGLDNVKAKLLANIPAIIGVEKFENDKNNIINHLENIVNSINYQKQIYLIVNNLIADWKNTDYEDRLGHKKDLEYKLTNIDYKIVEDKIISFFGKKSWEVYEEKHSFENDVRNLFQQFYRDEKRNFLKLPTLKDALKEFISENYLSKFTENEREKKLQKIYHPSERFFYSKSDLKKDGAPQLGSPKHPALKNPKVIRSLHIMRNHLNGLLQIGEIDSDTEIIIELARELNDINKAYAIEQYQKRQEEEREQIISLLKEVFLKKASNINPESSDDQDKLKFALEQIEMEEKDYNLYKPDFKRKENEWNYFNEFNSKKINKYIEKIKLWKEQNFRCIYTGKSISFSELFEEGKIDVEHTIPYSIYPDNSLKNKTVCDAHFNRKIKGNSIPFDLKEQYPSILNNIQHWIEKVEFIKERVEFWKAESKKANGDKERKDKAIREKHLWLLEYDYWSGKVDRFTVEEVTSKWINAQKSDTQIITRYAYHFLKTVFHKVRVEKGSITSDFRKILKIQPKEEREKNRSHNSHHAIDSAVLTLIPPSPKKDEILKEAGEYWKKYQKQYHGYKPYSSYNEGHILSIKDNILIDYKAKDNLFSRFEKIERKKGKKVPKIFIEESTKEKKTIYQKDEKGNVKYRLHKDGSFILRKDKNGNVIQDEHKGKIPIPEYKKLKGNGFRGSIYKDSFYGKVSFYKRDENFNLLLDESGNSILESNITVKREAIKDVLKKTNSILDPFVKLNIENEIERIKQETKEVKEGIREVIDTNIYQTNKKGKRALDRNGNPIIYRHIRCFVDNSVKVVPVKEHLFQSKTKSSCFLAQEEDVVLVALYEEVKKDKSGKTSVKRDIDTKKASDILKQRTISNIESELDFFEKRFDKTKREISPKYILKKKSKVVFFNENRNELKVLSNKDINKRLFLLSGIADNRAGKKLLFQTPFYSTEALKELPKKVSQLKLNEIIGEYILSQPNWNFVVEGYDFDIDVKGKIIWKF